MALIGAYYIYFFSHGFDLSCVLMCTCSFGTHSQVENQEAHQNETKPTAA